MKKVTVIFHLEKSGLEKKALDLVKKYRDYTSFNQSQSIIQLILRNEEYINSLCPGLDPALKSEESKRQDKSTDTLDFIREYEESDRINVFDENKGGDD